MNKFKYINQVSNKAGKKVVDMHLYDNIGFGGIKGIDFANEMKAQNADRVNVRICSKGGDVIEGFAILSAMLNFKNAGGELHTYNDGVAASTAGWLLQAADPNNIHSKDYAILMLHGVSNDTNDGKFQKAIAKIFKNRSGIDVNELMTNGQDNFFDTDEAIAKGFLIESNVENTGNTLPKSNDLLLIANAANEIISNNSNINIKKPLKMKRIANLLNLQEGSTEEVIANAISKTIADAEKQAKKLTEVQNTLKEKNTLVEKLQKQVKASNDLTATNLVEGAIKDGRLAPATEEDKKELINSAKSDLGAFEKMLKMIPVKASNIISNTKIGEEGKKSLIAKIDNRGLRQLEREDSGLLAEVKKNDKETYVNLYNEQYGTAKTIADFS